MLWLQFSSLADSQRLAKRSDLQSNTQLFVHSPFGLTKVALPPLAQPAHPPDPLVHPFAIIFLCDSQNIRHKIIAQYGSHHSPPRDCLESTFKRAPQNASRRSLELTSASLHQRADELLKLNQPQAAFAAISEVFQSRRFKSTPLSSLEPIMDRFLELCVQLKKGRQAKDGLYLFKNVAQNTSAGHVDAVIKKFLDLSKGKLQEAIRKVDELEGPLPAAPAPAAPAAASAEAGNQASVPQAEAEVEDLEASETPESILLSAVSEEKSRDRTYRTVVMPWLRFLWEAYRTSLDTLRNNARLEEFYQVRRAASCSLSLSPFLFLLCSHYNLIDNSSAHCLRGL